MLEDYFENEENGEYGKRNVIEWVTLEFFIKDDANATIYNEKCEIVRTVKGSALRDRIFDPINGRLNTVVVTDGV